MACGMYFKALRIEKELYNRVFALFRLLPEINALVVAEFSTRHVAVIANDLANVFGRHVVFLRFDEAEATLFAVAFRLQLLPFSR